ncbi:dioxygenase family protein [Ferruginibacter sp.]
MKRRTFVKNTSFTALGISVFGNISWNGKQFVGDSPTTTDILGPFYRPGAPLRDNLVLPGSKGTTLVLKGVIFKEDGKSPVSNALVEIWHCDENQLYDNTSDKFNYRGGQITKANGGYKFKTIIPVPYKADPASESSWRPAHIHMRVSVKGQQDLVTQIYFKEGKYVDTDKWSSSPGAKNRVLEITNLHGVDEITFNVVLQKEYKLSKNYYDKIEGVFDIGNDNKVEFKMNDDLLFTKYNGQLYSSLSYKGNNKFEGGLEDPVVEFILQEKGETTVNIQVDGKLYKGTRVLKY